MSLCDIWCDARLSKNIPDVMLRFSHMKNGSTRESLRLHGLMFKYHEYLLIQTSLQGYACTPSLHIPDVSREALQPSNLRHRYAYSRFCPFPSTRNSSKTIESPSPAFHRTPRNQFLHALETFITCSRDRNISFLHHHGGHVKNKQCIATLCFCGGYLKSRAIPQSRQTKVNRARSKRTDDKP